MPPVSTLGALVASPAVAAVAAVAAAAALAAPAAWAAGYSESVSGDLSGSGAAPTFVALSLGSNAVSGATGNGPAGMDLDYFTITVPAGQMLSALTVTPGTQALGVAFIGLQAGTQVTATASSPAALLGWAHYSSANIGSNILLPMSIGPGAIGFSGVLGAGSYSFWIQDFNTGTSSYAFDLTLAAVPEPAAALMLAGGLAAIALMRRR